MIQSGIRSLGRRAALIVAMAALAVGFGAASASAAVVVTPNTGVASGAEVTVSGTGAPSGTDEVAIVQCNAAAPGKRCDPASGTETLMPVSEYAEGISIPVRRGPWDDFDFTMGLPPKEAETDTTCRNEAMPPTGEQCLIVVSFYEVEEEEEKVITPVGMPQWQTITFK